MTNFQKSLLKNLLNICSHLTEECKEDDQFNFMLSDYNLFPLGLPEVLYKIETILDEESVEI